MTMPRTLTIITSAPVVASSSASEELGIDSYLGKIPIVQLPDVASKPFVLEAIPGKWLGGELARNTVRAEVNVDSMKKELAQTLDGLGEVFDSAEATTLGGLQLNELEVNLEVSVDGKIGILGTGLGVSGTTGLKLTFRRQPSASEDATK